MAKILLLILAMASGVLAQDCELLPGAVEWNVVILNAADQPARFSVEASDQTGTLTVAANSRGSLYSLKYGAWRVTLLTFTKEDALRQLEQELTDKIKSQKLDPAELKSIQAQLEDIRNQVALWQSIGASCSGTFTLDNRVVDINPAPSALVTSARVGQEWVLRC